VAWLELAMFSGELLQFNAMRGGFEANSDGMTFADFVHHEHPVFDWHYVAINPVSHGQ